MQKDDALEFYSRSDVVNYFSFIDQLTLGEAYLFEKYISEGAEVLDLGVGAGRTTSSLSRRAQPS